MRFRRNALMIGLAYLLVALCTAVPVFAHNWGCWKQPNRTVYSYNTAALRSQAAAAISEWDTKTTLVIPAASSHTEMSVFDGYYGNTGWAGLASIESYSGCNILHGHARVNRSYSYTSNGYRGIFCQEVGHLFGLDHSNDGGCMGGGYYYSINTYYTVVQHNINDIASKYAGVPLAAKDAEPQPEPGKTHAIAVWHERPRTLQEAADRSRAVVVAHALRVDPGPDLAVPSEAFEDGVDRIPTQRIVFEVENVLRGDMPEKRFVLFRTGNENFILHEEPAYAAGERWILFVTPRDDGTYRVIAPEGRMKVSRDGLELASEGEFMSELNGKSLDSFADELAAGTKEPATLQLRLEATRPFGSGAVVSYALARASDVELRVFDVSGRVVTTLVNARQEAGTRYTVEWDGTDDRHAAVASGVYYVRLRTQDGERSLSVVRIR